VSKPVETTLGTAMFALYSGVLVSISFEDYLRLLISFAWLYVVVWMFHNKRWYLRVFAVVSNLILLFVIFLPKHLKNGIKELKAKEIS
jgi:hypothetical protein